MPLGKLFVSKGTLVLSTLLIFAVIFELGKWQVLLSISVNMSAWKGKIYVGLTWDMAESMKWVLLIKILTAFVLTRYYQMFLVFIVFGILCYLYAL